MVNFSHSSQSSIFTGRCNKLPKTSLYTHNFIHLGLKLTHIITLKEIEVIGFGSKRNSNLIILIVQRNLGDCTGISKLKKFSHHNSFDYSVIIAQKRPREGSGGRFDKWYIWRIGDSNPSPPPCKGGALPNELIPLIKFKHNRDYLESQEISPSALCFLNFFGSLVFVEIPASSGKLLVL
jgi:hypothetical protein